MKRVFRADAIQALVNQGHLDAGEGIVFARELENIEAQVYEIKYPDLKGRSMLPAFGGLSPTDETWTWRIMDKHLAEADEAELTTDEIPTVDVLMAETHSGFVDIVQGYGYTIDEIQKSQRLGRPLDLTRATLAREAVERKFDSMIALGSKNASLNGLYGLLNQPLDTASGFVHSVSVASGDLTAGASGTGTVWDPNAASNACTVKEIVRQLNQAFAYVTVGTNMIHRPDTLVLDTKTYTAWETTPASLADANYSASDKSLLDYIKGQCKWLKNIDWWLKCNTAGPSSKARAVLYEKKQENGCYGISREFTQMPVQVKNFKFWIPCFGKCGGVKIRYPKSMVYIDGIQP